MKQFSAKISIFLLIALFVNNALYGQTAPTLTGFSPVSGVVGSSVTLTGTNFNTTMASNVVYFGATQATVTAATSTSLTVTVPSGATHSTLSVLNTSTKLAAFTKTEFIPTYSGGKGTAFAASDYNTQTTYNLGTNYQSSGVVLCDVDGDGKPDMIASNPYTNQISILLNNGSGSTVSFGSKTSYNVGASGTSPMCSPAFADLDGDGKPDIVVGDNGSGTVSIFKNGSSTGSLSLGSRQTVTTLGTPYAIAFADFDGDGKPDMIVAHNGSTSTSVFPNTSASGTISFGTRIDVAIGGAAYHGIGIADYDGDGKVDFAILNRGGSAVSVVLNTSTSSISFATKVDFTLAASNGYWLSTADIDGDGKKDLAVCYETGSIASVFRNTTTTIGTVTMGTRQDLTCLSNSRNVCFGDINGDGKVDMLIPAFSGTAAMYLNTSSSGTISFATASTVNIGAYPEGGTMGDVNADGKPDIVQPNFGGFSIYVTRNDATTANADLSTLTISAGTLSPVFASATTTYTDNVPYTTANVTVTPTKSDVNSVIDVRVNGGSYSTVASASASGSLTLVTGTNTIDVRVTAQGGAVIKTYTITVTKAAAPANALNFDGTDDYVTVTNNTAFNTSTYTAEAWVKLTATSNTYQCIFGRRTPALGWNFYSDNANKWSLWNGWGEVISGPATTFGQWMHVAVTGSASGQKMYINGVLVGSTASVVSPATDQDFVIGKVSEANAWFAKGNIDEVRFWNVERTATEIAANMNGTVSPATSGLISYYRFDQGTAGGTNTGLTSLTDGTANGLNGTLNNFALTGATSNWVTGFSLPTWTGTTSTDWNTATNWSTNAVPTSMDIVSIPSTSNAPNNAGTATVASLTVASGVTVTNSGSINITGALSNAGTITGTVTLNGSSAQTIAGTGSIANLTLNNSTGATINSGMTSLTGTLTIASGTLTTGGFLTLKSNAAGTARIAAITSGGISGNVTQERYIPAKASKTYDFVASPFAQTISSSWQQQVHITGVGTGGTICPSLTAHTNGFDATATNAASMFVYDGTKAVNTRWTSVTGTTGVSLAPGTGYRMNIRGPRSAGCSLLDGTVTSVAAVTLSSTGTLSNANKNMGSFSIGLLNNGNTTVANDNYMLTGNPYPSQVSFASLLAANNGASGINNAYAIYAPGNTVGNYAFWNGTTFTGGNTGLVDATGDIIANGQAFFVQGKVAGAGVTLSWAESMKSATANNGYFRTQSNPNRLRIGYMLSNGSKADEIMVQFASDGTTNELNNQDIVSINSGAQNLKSLKAGRELAFNTRSLHFTNDTVHLDVVSSANGTYKLSFYDFDELVKGTNAKIWLIDSYTGTAQLMNDNKDYTFTVTTATPATQGVDRFSVVFAKQPAISLLPISNIKVYPNPFANQLTVDLPALNSGNYSIKLTDVSGRVIIEQKAQGNTAIKTTGLVIGTYILEITNPTGEKQVQKIVKN